LEGQQQKADSHRRHQIHMSSDQASSTNAYNIIEQENEISYGGIGFTNNANTLFPQTPTTNIRESKSFQESLAIAKSIINKFNPSTITTNLTLQECRTIEKQKINKALLKNYQYITDKDVQTLQLCNDTVHTNVASTDRFHTKLGIGTKERNKQQTNLHKLIHHEKYDNCIYVNGLNKNKTQQDIENELQYLFQTIGNIQRIKLYRNHKNKLKGDALIIFHDSIQDIDSICKQVRFQSYIKH